MVVLSERTHRHAAAASRTPSSRSRATPRARSPSRPQYAQAGTNAAYTINGGPTQYSTSNTISGVAVPTPTSATPGATQTIPGVTLSLNGLTGSTPVTVSVGSPAPSQQNIQTAVQKFITDYNSAITQIQTQLTQTPSSSDPTQGTLYGDTDLQQLLSSMRQKMAATVGGLTGSMSSMLDAGVSTGATHGHRRHLAERAGRQPDARRLNPLTSALTSNSSGVKSMFTSWSINFSSLVDTEGGPGGTISVRMQADTSQSSFLANQIQNLTEANQLKQNQLVQEFAAMEAALSQNQSTSNWLTSQLAALPTIS